MYIYLTINIINDKIYIGQCSKLVRNSENYLGSGTYLNRSIKFYGKKNFVKIILRDNIFNQNQLDTWEAIYIKKYKSTDINIGYNILPGTANKFSLGSPMKIDRVKEKCRASLIKIFKDNPELGKKLSKSMFDYYENNPNFKQKLSELGKKLIGDKNPNYGNYWSKEQKEKASNNKIGKNLGINNPNYGNKWDNYQRTRMSIRMIGKAIGDKNPNFNNKWNLEQKIHLSQLKSKIEIHIINDECVNVLKSSLEASILIGIDKRCFSDRKRNFIYNDNGFRFKIIEKS